MMSPLQNHYSFIFVVVATTILATTMFTNTEACNGVLISYSSTVGRQLPSYVTNPKEQPYRFESTLIVLNNGRDEIKSWEVFVGFQHNEVLVSASNVVLSDGTTLPARVGNGTVFSGFPLTDLKTAIWTAGDLKQMQAQISLVGTVFGVKPPDVPSPSSISLVNDGFICDKATAQGKNEINVCCIRDPNITADEKFLTSQREISLSQTLKYEYF